MHHNDREVNCHAFSHLFGSRVRLFNISLKCTLMVPTFAFVILVFLNGVCLYGGKKKEIFCYHGSSFRSD